MRAITWTQLLETFPELDNMPREIVNRIEIMGRRSSFS